MITNIFFNDFDKLKFNNSKYDVNHIYSLIQEKVGNDKKLINVVFQYLIKTGNFDLLDSKILEKNSVLNDTFKDVEDTVIKLLADFKSYDKELLIFDIMNIFGVSEGEVNNILMDLEKRRHITVHSQSISLVDF